MYAEAEKLLENAQEQDRLLACVVDMDGLKYINDTFGHAEGDYGIRVVADAVARMTGEGEICCRAGGDEFYMIGVGQYTEDDLLNRESLFNSNFSAIIFRRVDFPEPFPPLKIVISEKDISCSPLFGNTLNG